MLLMLLLVRPGLRNADHVYMKRSFHACLTQLWSQVHDYECHGSFGLLMISWSACMAEFKKTRTGCTSLNSFLILSNLHRLKYIRGGPVTCG